MPLSTHCHGASEMRVTALHRPDEDAPVITVDIGEDYGTEITPDEAAQVVESLQLLLGLITADGAQAVR